MRPALKSYVYFVQTSDGVYFRGGSRAFELRVPGAYELVSRLLARLDGSHSETVIAQSLPAKVQPLFEKLVAALRTHGMLVNADEGEHSIPERVSRLYHATLLYLQDHVDGYQAAFSAWRDTHYFIVGHGHTLKSASRAMARQGVRRLTLVQDSASQFIEEISDVLEEHKLQDPEFEYSVAKLEQALALRKDAKWLYASDDLQSMESMDCLSRVRKEAVRVLVGGVLYGHGIVGPSGAQGAATFFDLQARLRPVAGMDSKLHSPVSCSMLGNSLALQALNLACGIQPERLDHQFLRVTPLLETTVHPVFPTWNRTPTAIRSLHLDKKDGEAEGDSEYEVLRTKLAPLFDPVAGIFSDAEGRYLDQLPLHHDAISIRIPGIGAVREESVLAWGLSPAEAGARAIRSAVVAYCELVESAEGRAERVLVAHEHEEEWAALAFAVGVLRSRLFADRAVVTEVPASWTTDQALQQLVRIHALYSGASLSTRLYCVPRLPAYLAETTSGQTSEIAFGRTPFDALRGSIGAICSALQFPGRQAKKQKWNIRAACEVRDFTVVLEEAESAHMNRLSDYGFVSVRQPFDLDDSFRALNIFVGSVNVVQRG